MSGFSKTVIVGRLARDPEVRFFQDGSAVCNMTVVTSDEWKDKNTGEKKERAEFHRVTVFRKLAELCGEYLSKGRMCLVEGKLQTRSYDKDGQTHYATEIVADKVQFLGGGRDQSGTTPAPPCNSGQQARPGAGAYGGAQGGYEQGQNDYPPDSDEIPF